MTRPWYQLDTVDDLPTPALVIHPERVQANLLRMIAWVGSPERLWTHVKTHKLPQLVAMQRALGIEQFKCATLAEAEMAARAGARRVIVAFPLVGPNPGLLARLVKRHGQTQFLAIADGAEALARLSAELTAAGQSLEVLIDLDVGQGRTGVAPGPAAIELYRLVNSLPGLNPGGLHAYDGHIKAPDFELRRGQTEAAFAPVDRLRATLQAQGLPVPRVVAGGTTTFSLHAARPDRQCSPGTCVLWDYSYASKYAELDFQFAAVLLTRVVSKPSADRICLDLGYKAVACDNPDPRIWLCELPGARQLVHSEEHLVLSSPQAGRLRVGDVVHAIPYHVCPTCALHDEVLVARHGSLVERWPVVARVRQLTAAPGESNL